MGHTLHNPAHPIRGPIQGPIRHPIRRAAPHGLAGMSFPRGGRARLTAAVASTVLSSAALALAGCGGFGIARAGEREVTPQAFAAEDAPRPLIEAQRDRRDPQAPTGAPAEGPAEGPASGASRAAIASLRAPDPTGTPQAAGRPRDPERSSADSPDAGLNAPLLTVTPGDEGPRTGLPASETAETAAEPDGPPTLLEEKVGDINGRPIFAREFLEPLSGRMLAQAERLEPEPWRLFAAQLIRRELRSLVTDELLRAEAIDRLNEQQRAGLRAFLRQVSEQLQSQNLGSRQLAARRLQEERGLTEQEFLEQRRESALIQLVISEEISSRVTVSWRDIVRRYERESDRWNPDPVAVLRIARVRTEDAGAIERAEASAAELSEFVGFAESEANTFLRDRGGRTEVTLTTDYADAELFPNDTLNAAARGLEPGRVEGPIELGPFSYWIALEQIRRESTPLYDAQLTIERAIEAERQEAELDAYIDTLIRRARVTSLQQIGDRLLDAAQRWYGPEREARTLGRPR